MKIHFFILGLTIWPQTNPYGLGWVGFRDTMDGVGLNWRFFNPRAGWVENTPNPTQSNSCTPHLVKSFFKNFM